MPSAETVERFVELVESRGFMAANGEFYAVDPKAQESLASTWRDRLVGPLVRGREYLSRDGRVQARCVRPVLQSGDMVAIRWKVRCEWRDGSFSDFEEMAHQQWRDDRIVGETLFHDPLRQAPKSLSMSF